MMSPYSTRVVHALVLQWCPWSATRAALSDLPDVNISLVSTEIPPILKQYSSKENGEPGDTILLYRSKA